MIQLNDNLFIKADNNGKPLSEVLGYYGRLEQALQGAYNVLVRKLVDVDEIMTLSEAIKSIRKIREEFEHKVFNTVALDNSQVRPEVID